MISYYVKDRKATRTAMSSFKTIGMLNIPFEVKIEGIVTAMSKTEVIGRRIQA